MLQGLLCINTSYFFSINETVIPLRLETSKSPTRLKTEHPGFKGT